MVSAGERLIEPINATEAGERWLEGALAPDEQAALAKQGFIAVHTLPSGARCAKLRFRDSKGRQRVRYLGTNRQLVDDVAAALKARQRAVLRRQAARRTVRCCRRKQRELKCRLDSPLRCAGWHFHGLSLRRRRSRVEGMNNSCHSNLIQLRRTTTMNDELVEEVGPASGRDVYGRQIFDEFRRSAISHPDPAQAILRFAVADFMDIAATLCAPIRTELQSAPDKLDALEDLAPSIEMMLKLSRQADRLLNIAINHEGGPPPAKAKNCDLDTYDLTHRSLALGFAAADAEGQSSPEGTSKPR